MERYDSLGERRAVLDAATLAHAQPTPVHMAMVDVLSNLLSMGNQFSSEKVPVQLRTMMRVLDQMKPTLVTELARIPADQIQTFMAGLRDELDRIVQAPGATLALPAGESDLSKAPDLSIVDKSPDSTSPEPEEATA
jgi:hypothetical protein